MNDIRRAVLLELLREIDYSASPEQIQLLGKGVEHAAKLFLQTFEEAWKKFKEFGSNAQELLDAAKNFSFEDIKILLEKDPASLACLTLDAISLVDSTGLADIVQGFVLLYQDEIFWGVLSIVFGLIQAAGTYFSGGVATPIWAAIKKGYMISVKNISKEALEEILKVILLNSSKLLNFLKNSIVGRKFFDIVNSFINKAQNFKKYAFNTTEEAIQYLSGFRKSALITPEIKKKIIEGTLLIAQLKFFQAGVGGAHLKAMQEKLPSIRELYMRKVVCKKSKQNEEWCKNIITNKDLSLSGDEIDVATYESQRQQLNPLMLINWYNQVGSKMPP